MAERSHTTTQHSRAGGGAGAAGATGAGAAAATSRSGGPAAAAGQAAGTSGRSAAHGGNELSVVLIALFKGVVDRNDDERKWRLVERYEGRIQDYVSVLGLSLVVYREEGFAFLTSSDRDEEESDLPRLVPRRQLSYPVSLTLALLRKRLAEHDSFSGEERLVLDTEDVVEMVRTFLPAGTNEAKATDQILSSLRRVADLGFIRFLSRDENKLEVKRIIKAFVDAQWLEELDRKLAEYAEHAAAAFGSEDEQSQDDGKEESDDG